MKKILLTATLVLSVLSFFSMDVQADLVCGKKAGDPCGIAGCCGKNALGKSLTCGQYSGHTAMCN